ncbi:hypothetical protein M5D96_001953 [Drosophila gunungcola]|uniref:Uncharacterized protein n=1 Tax=Drosophila gunungcola TaxID=103775 RepID=A0A9P9YZ51_9MUSC|nr:hypothetical protein M5D96_001953 [Drosophila gunungcola]
MSVWLGRQSDLDPDPNSNSHCAYFMAVTRLPGNLISACWCASTPGPGLSPGSTFVSTATSTSIAAGTAALHLTFNIITRRLCRIPNEFAGHYRQRLKVALRRCSR